MADQEINIKINGIAEIKKQLRDLKGELAQATDPEQMAELAAQAGVLSDRLKDANEKVAVFAAGSPFEQTSNALGLMGSQLMSMDFEGAAESAKSFALAAKGINGDVIANSLKSLGTVVFQVGKAFMSVGLSLLTNPIFLIAAAIAAIVAIIVLLMNKLGLLKPILDAIGKVFGWIMDIIDGVIQGFRMLTDWLGLTANAAEDSAKRQIAASEKTLEVLEKNSESKIDAMDHEIRLAKIQGKDVAILEAKKQQELIKTTQVRMDLLTQQIKLHEKLGDLEDADLKKLKDSLAEQKKALREANQDMQALREENKKKVAENEKKVAENSKKIREQNRSEADQYAKDRLAAARMIEDMNLQLMEEGTEKELLANKIKHRRLIEDTKSNDKLTKSEKLKAIEELGMLEAQARDVINQKIIADEKLKQEKINKVILEAKNIAAQNEEDFYEEYRLATTSKDQLEIDAINEKYFRLIEIAKQYGLDTTTLEKQQQDELDKIRDEAAEKEKERKMNLANATLELTRSSLQGAADLVSAFAGKSIAAQKRAFEINKKINIAQATIDTFKGAVSAFNGTVTALGGGPWAIAAGALAAAGVVASGIANIKKIVSTKFESSSAPSAASSSSSSTSTQPMQPNVQMFGQGNNANNMSSPKDVEANKQQPVIKAVVVESDITTSQSRVKKMQENATL